MFCKVCGKELADSAIFCGNCGTKIEREIVIEKVEETTETVEEVVEEATQLTETAEENMVATESENEEEVVTVCEEIEDKMQDISEDTDSVAVEVNEDKASAFEAVEPAHETISAPEVTPAPAVPVEDKEAATKVAKDAVKVAKEEMKALKAADKAERKKFMVKRNTVLSTIACVFLSIIVTAVIFATTAVALLCAAEFDTYFFDYIYYNIEVVEVFCIIVSLWYLYALAAILVLLALLILAVIKRRKYAFFNYIGIPMIINGSIFALMAVLSKWIVKTFDLPDLFMGMFEAISDEAKNLVLISGIILLAAGIFFVLLYVLIAVIHKAVYRKKCMNVKANQ